MSDVRNVEYRVVWKREACHQKSKTVRTSEGAVRRLGILTSDEPWIYYRPRVDPDAFVCCAGDKWFCGCGGMTYREESAARRAAMATLEYARIEERTVGEWRPSALGVSRKQRGA